MEAILAGDVETNVCEWITKYLGLLDRRIEQAKVEEEIES
jgi:hypothetical protein